MKKLGKKLISSQETIEAYCGVCSHCSCSVNCVISGKTNNTADTNNYSSGVSNASSSRQF